MKKAPISQGFFTKISGRIGLTIPVVHAATEPEEVEPVLTMNHPKVLGKMKIS